MNLSAHIESFLKYLEFDRPSSKLTVKNYSHYLKKFLEFAGEADPKNIDLPLIAAYKLHLSKHIDPKSKKPLKKITQNYFIIALRTFLRYLETKDIQTLSAQKVKLSLQEAKKTIKVLKKDQLQQLLDAPNISKIDGIRDRAILETLFSTGLRVSELASLNRDTTDLIAKEFTIKGLGGKNRQVYISENAAGWLIRYLSFRKDTFNPLFIRFQGKVVVGNNGESMRLTTRSIERIVEKYAKAQKLPVKATPQILRHSYAADLIGNGTDIHSVKEVLGHNNLSTTQLYKLTTTM